MPTRANRAEDASGDAGGAPVRPLDVAVFADARGMLFPFDLAALPFVPRRVFAVAGVPAGTVRGGHGHRRGVQLLVCIQGRIAVATRVGAEERISVLTPSSPGLMIEAGVWSRQTYEDAGSVLLVLSSEPYDPASYVDGN